MLGHLNNNDPLGYLSIKVYIIDSYLYKKLLSSHNHII